MKKAKLFFSALFVFMGVTLFAQNITIKGTIKDASSGEAIPFAAVQIKGTLTGVAADAEGAYTISAPATASLVVSSIGYLNEEVAVEGRNTINISLRPDAEALENVVVVAYGTQSAKTVTAAVASIKSDLLKDAPNVSFDSMLQGQASGVQVSSPSGGAGAQAKVLIRGVSSISAGTDPLYVVDGVPIASSVISNAYTEANALSDINPADIASIEVLKDAAATALYGSRAASGVILITTKQGRKGEAKVTYDMSVGFTQPTKMFEMMDADTYVKYKNQAVYNRYGTDEVSLGGDTPYGNKAFNLMTDSKGNTIRTKWSDLVFKNGLIQNHTVAISGGSDKTQYYASPNYADNSGIIIGDQYHRYGIKANVSSQVNIHVLNLRKHALMPDTTLLYHNMLIIIENFIRE